MSLPLLPVELLDHIVDYLHDTRDALKSCRLVSRSWAPRTRKHLFANVTFYDAKDLQSWKNMFPDPSTSPACYTKNLTIRCPKAVTSADLDAEERGWIAAFSRVVHFDLNLRDAPEISLLPFHGFSPALKSLRTWYNYLPSSQIFDFINSFPLIEDLSLIVIGESYPAIDDIDGQSAAPLPPLTGSLEIFSQGRMNSVVSRFFPPQNSLHFRELGLELVHQNDILVISALVERCRFTLESLKVYSAPHCEQSLGPIDLSKATRLKHVKFWWGRDPRWAVKALRTVTHDNRNLQLSLETTWKSYGHRVGSDDLGVLLDDIGGACYQGWLELDSVLAQLWESHSIRPEVTYNVPTWMGKGTGRRMQILLPEVTARGIVDLVEQNVRW